MEPAFFILLIVVSSLVVTVGALGESPNLRIVIKGGFWPMPMVLTVRLAVRGTLCFWAFGPTPLLVFCPRPI